MWGWVERSIVFKMIGVISMKYGRLLGIAGLGLLLGGCASLMMDAKEVDQASAGLSLKAGDQVALAEPDVKAVAESSDPENAARVAKLLKEDLAKELAKKQVQVSASADKQLTVRITGYEKGCGFCRGFFPLFGLGDSAVNGEADLAIGSQHRKIVLTKTGQTSGMAEMGDQTETNSDYFATVAVAHLTEAGEEKSDAKKAD